MATSVRARITGKNGAPVTVYAEQHGGTVWMHTKDANLGGYRLTRFPGGALTAASLAQFLAGWKE